MLSERELAARVEINWERYVKVCNIEASTALDIAKTMILPAAIRYLGSLAAAGSFKSAIHALRDGRGLHRRAGGADRRRSSMRSTRRTRRATVSAEAKAFVDDVIPAQNALREIVDELETVVADDLWPLPKYRELLFQY